MKYELVETEHFNMTGNVYGLAAVSDDAEVSGMSRLRGNSKASGDVLITGDTVLDNVTVSTGKLGVSE